MGRRLLHCSGPCRRQRGGAGWGPPAGLSPRWVPPMQRERKRERPPREGDGPTVGPAKGSGAVGATPLPDAPDLVTSCSATDWQVELLLDGGPGGSDAVGAFIARDLDRLAGSESGRDTEPSVSVCACVFTLWVIICRSMLARSREIWKLARSREKRR
eukprot:scaffold39551_cov57-Phaeocystis_antarctica.AAC.2